MEIVREEVIRHIGDLRHLAERELEMLRANVEIVPRAVLAELDRIEKLAQQLEVVNGRQDVVGALEILANEYGETPEAREEFLVKLSQRLERATPHESGDTP